MRLTSTKAVAIKPIQRFEVAELSDVIVLAGPNGVGKSRLVERILQHLQNPQAGTSPVPADRSRLPEKISVIIEATDPNETTLWGKKTLDTSIHEDGLLFLRALQNSKYSRRNFQSSVLYFESDRSIQQIDPFQFTWDLPDPWEERVAWNFGWGGLRNRFKDTLHGIFRKVKSLEDEMLFG